MIDDDFEPPEPPSWYLSRMRRYGDATDLEVVSRNSYGRNIRLSKEAANAWRAMIAAASSDGIQFELISGFRGYEEQLEIFRRKIARGLTMAEILKINAYPGFSEHHSGCAVDIGTKGFADLEEEFEESPAFHWLCSNAKRFGFIMSYPRDNSFGLVYEPWHWMFRDEIWKAATGSSFT